MDGENGHADKTYEYIYQQPGHELDHIGQVYRQMVNNQEREGKCQGNQHQIDAEDDPPGSKVFEVTIGHRLLLNSLSRMPVQLHTEDKRLTEDTETDKLLTNLREIIGFLPISFS
jgi:hypothetical protein